MKEGVHVFAREFTERSIHSLWDNEPELLMDKKSHSTCGGEHRATIGLVTWGRVLVHPLTGIGTGYVIRPSKLDERADTHLSRYFEESRCLINLLA